MLAGERMFTRATKFDASDFGGKTEWPYSGLDLARMDESSDIYFYQEPRFVTHIDDGAIAALTAYYEQAIVPDSDVLDICSSWVSHLPQGLALGRVAGLGMNARELEANPALSEWVQADLNVDPKLPFADESFDYVLNVVSVDYLSQPKEVFEEMHRVLRPGGQAIMSFSNRCFPSKAVKMWLNADDERRQKIVASYYHYAPSGGWENIMAIDLQAGAKPIMNTGGLPDLGALFRNIMPAGDPMFIVRANKCA